MYFKIHADVFFFFQKCTICIHVGFIWFRETFCVTKHFSLFFICFRFLQANADASVINCMHNLSRRIAIALQHEERRCQYLTREAKLMLAVQDEVTTMTESETSHSLEICSVCPADIITEGVT